ncbi:hypothetical protein SLS56_009697 [Neofusicoccum ribis]|uniref:Uncharacterized protein n=1 Tax=Neofusicoccum ribis TaxID=45134 RepID=A0ABR3SHA5_9PEZI
METAGGGHRGLPGLPQELIDQICDELLDGRGWEHGAGADVRAMHYTCKAMQRGTCKLILRHSITFDARGAALLWLMSRNKNIIPPVNHIELCCTNAPIDSAEANGPYVDRSRTASTSASNSNKTPRGQKEAKNYKSLINDITLLLSDAVGQFSNLTGMKLTVEPDEALFGAIQGLQDHYKPERTHDQYKRAFMSLWQVRVMLQSLVKSSLVELELVDVNNTPKVETTNDRLLFPSDWLSPLKSIMTLKLDNRSGQATLNTWRKFLKTIRDDLNVENLELNGFASQYGYNMNTHIPIISHHPGVRWHPDRLPDGGSELDEIIDERGIWKALSDWIDGMLVRTYVTLSWRIET